MLIKIVTLRKNYYVQAINHLTSPKGIGAVIN